MNADYRKKLACRIAISIAALTGIQSIVQAQATPPAVDAATKDAGDRDTIVLSPFEVSGSSDVGYDASSTLAGNRLRTDIRDVATSVSVYTSKFLQDTASVNAHDLLIYSVGTEVGGVYGNYSAAVNKGSFFDDTGSGNYVSPNSDTRVRGLSAADVTRNFFISDITFDAYNLDRVDIQRGANSVLFGLAAPGGVINYNLNQASFKNGGSVTYKTDQFGTQRVNGDYNAVLIPHQAAIRLDVLDDEHRFEQKEAWNHNRRYYGAIRVEPSVLNNANVSTSFRANFENGSITGSDPETLPPRDSITPWFSVANKAVNVPYGTVSIDPATGKLNDFGYTNAAQGYSNAGSYQTDAQGNVLPASAGAVWFANPGRWYENLGAVYLQPNSSVQGGNGVPGFFARRDTNNNNLFNFGGVDDSSAILGKLHNQPGFWHDQTLTDTSIFDFYHHQLFGDNRFNGQNFNALNLALSQTFLNNQFGYEIAYDNQRTKASQINGGAWEEGKTINIDVNKTLPDGTPNPNFGRPFVASDYVDDYLDFRTRRSTRATAFYDLNVASLLNNSTLGRIIGRHVFTGLLSTQSDKHESLRYSGATVTADIAQAEGHLGSPFNWENFAAIHYIGPSLASASSAAGSHLSPITAVQIPSQNNYSGEYFDPIAKKWVTTPVGVDNNPYDNTFNASLIKQVVNSRALVWQGHMFDDVVVPTIAWRTDTAKGYNSANPPNSPTGFSVVSDLHLPTTPSNTIKGTNTSYSVVVHTPKRIKDMLPGGLEVDLTYNKSQNFTPSATNVLLDNSLAPPQTGTTKDYGVKLYALNQRLYFSVKKFESAAENASSGDVNTFFLVQEEVNFWNAAHDPFNIQNHPDAVAAYNKAMVSDALMKAWSWTVATSSITGQPTATAGRPNGFVSDLVDTTSRGYEYELGGRPMKGWDVYLNASETTAVLANNLKDVVGYMNDRIPVWTGLAGTMATSANTPTNTLAQEAQSNIIIPYQTGLAKDGLAAQDLVKWRFNLVNNYAFSDGALKGVNVGVGVRYQGHIAIGYPVKISANGSMVYDLANPYFGPSQLDCDLWVGYTHAITHQVNWKIQLNAKNLFQSDKLIPISAQPDGTIAASRIQGGALYTLTNTFSF